MTDPTRAQAFASALQDLERTGEVEEMAARFAPDAELTRPEVEKRTGQQSPAEFWTRYLEPFGQVSSTFGHVEESGDLAVLEWESEGTLADGSPISYRGVSVLVFGGSGDGADLVQRFATYFDTAAFVPGPAQG